MRKFFRQNCLLVSWLAVATVPALADVPWIADNAACDTVTAQIDRFQLVVREGVKLTERQRGEFAVVLHEACGSRFASCDIPICKSLAERTKANAESAGPLAWLDAPLDCKGLQREVKSRYGALGAFSELPESKRIEVGYVLDLVCSPRFAACGFKQCTQSAEAKASPESGNPPVGVDAMTAEIADRLAMAAEQLSGETQSVVPTETPAGTQPQVDPGDTEVGETPEDRAVQQAMAEYERLVQEEVASRQALMEVTIEAEKRERKKWNRIGNPEELAVVEERRKRSKTTDDETEADRGRNKPYYSDYFKPSGSGRSGTETNRPKSQSKQRSSKSQSTSPQESSPSQPRRDADGNQREPIVF